MRVQTIKRSVRRHIFQYSGLQFLAHIRSRVLKVALMSMWGGLHLSAQSLQPVPLSYLQETGSPASLAIDGKGYTLHVNTREVVVEVVARDSNDHPIGDLKQSEFDIFEDAERFRKHLRVISAFRTVDPALERIDLNDNSRRRLVLPIGGRCEVHSTVHYEIAFHPTKWLSGYHSVLVTTTRRHTRLSYRMQYYLGVSDVGTQPTRRDAKGLDTDLQKAACYHANVPASLSLSVKQIDAQDALQLHYSLRVLPSSLDIAGIDEASHHVVLDYGICAFDTAGHILDYWHFSEDRSLGTAEAGKILSSGWPELIEVPRNDKPALVRAVVREPRSGNLGIIDLSTSVPTSSDDIEESDLQASPHILVAPEGVSVAKGSARSLGSPLPREGALCGDVYELPTTTTFLPDDFRVLNAVGAIYTNSLNISERVFEQGIPGSTPRSEWFGVDYFGRFWVSKPGKYSFVLNADDGADLYIDDRRVISNDGIHPPQTIEGSIMLESGRHTIRLPYFQGPTYVNLVLKVKSPDESLKVFDMRDFSEPAPRLN